MSELIDFDSHDSKMQPENVSYDCGLFVLFCYGNSISTLTNGKSPGGNPDDILNFDSKQIEQYHNFIQWIFPTITRSQFNPYAPVLELKDFIYIRSYSFVNDRLIQFAKMMIDFWCIFDSNVKILHSLHVSRMIECLTLYGFNLDRFLNRLQQLININILNPYHEVYNGVLIPVWFIRSLQAKKLLEASGYEYGIKGDIIELIR